jgi:hypothetical protein
LSSEPNWGRESYAYLLYLEESKGRKELANFVWLTQAPAPSEADTSELWARLALLSPRTGMLGLGLVLFPKIASETDRRIGGGCEQNRAPGWYKAIAPHLAAIHLAAQRRVCTGMWVLFMHGELVVSRRRVRRAPSWLFISLREALELPDDNKIHADPRWRERPWGLRSPVYPPSTRQSPLLGYNRALLEPHIQLHGTERR